MNTALRELNSHIERYATRQGYDSSTGHGLHSLSGASTLLELTKQPDAMIHPDGTQIKITHQEISRIVGCTREMVSRVLRILEKQGLVSAKGKTMVVYGTH